MRRRSGWLRRIVEDEDEGTAGFGAGGREMHRGTARDNDMGPSGSPDHLPFRGFQTRFTSKGVPSLRPRMPMCGRRHARRENRLHVLRRVFRVGIYWERADFRNACTAGRAPASNVDREKPHFSEGLHDSSTGSFGGFRFGTRCVSVQVPKDRSLWELSECRLGRDPAAEFTGSLADRFADLCKCLLTHRECCDDARENDPPAA